MMDLVEGNDIGTDVSGTKSLGNGFSGVYVTCQSNTIGGTTPGAGNVISANGTANGYQGNTVITISGGLFGNTGSLIQGNSIGTDVTGTINLGNVGDGVYITAGANINTIGGSAANAANVIRFNGNDGVNVDRNSVMDPISQNSIFDNSRLGIDLENAGGNAGGNNEQPAPILTAYSAPAGGNTQTGWTLIAAPMTTFTIEFFANDLGSGQSVSGGQTFLTSMLETTDAAGNVSFALTTTLPAGQSFVTATATDPDGNTSQVSLQTSTTVLTSSANPSVIGQGVTFTAAVPNPGPGIATWTGTFTIDGHVQTPAAHSVVDGVDEAIFTSATLGVGPHTISAVYSDDTAFATSTTGVVTQTVSSAPEATSTALSGSSNPSTFGQTVTFTAVVAPIGQATSVPTGSVTFTIDDQLERSFVNALRVHSP
jgi:hypothetical protein